MSDVTRFFYDTEFLEDGKTIDLLSFGMVNEDESDCFYAVNLNANWQAAYRNEWLKDNVLSSIGYQATPSDEIILSDEHQCTYTDIKFNLMDFVFKNTKPDTKAEFWAYYGDYDHVALSQLFGSMLRLPKNFPMYTMDIKQLAVMKGNPQLPEQAYGEHNALADARHNLQMFKFLTSNNIPISEEWL